MGHKIRQLGEKTVPGLLVGLFIGRILSELWGNGWQSAVAVTFLCTLFSLILFQRWRLVPVWPVLFLAMYLFYPQVNPTWAGVTAVFTLLTFCFLTTFSPRRPQYLVLCGFFFCALFALYLFTLAPDVLPADQGEFQLVAARLGVAHPPGFPLYTLLGHLATRFPWPVSPAYKLNLFSAVTSTLTLVFVYASVHRLTQQHGGAVTAVLALATSTTFWSQATTANIRSLTALFTAVAFFILLTLKTEDKTATERYLVGFVFVLTLGITHHTSLLFMALIWLGFLWLIRKREWQQPRFWIRPFFAASLALLPLLYLPWRATANTPGTSPSLATWNGFLDHLLARGFRGDFFYFIEPALLWERLNVMGNVLTFQFTPWLLAGMGAGLIWLLWQKPKVAFLLGGSFVLHTFVTATYRAPQTVEYMLPAYVSAVLCLGYGVGQLTTWQHNKIIELVGKVGAAGLLTAALFQGVQHYPSFAYLHQDNSTRHNAQTLLAEAPAGAVILADWHWATPLWYLQSVEGIRPDVTIHFVFPEGEPYAETWARRIGTELANGRFVITTHFDENTYTVLPPPEPIGDAFLFRQTPRTQVPDSFTPVNLSVDNQIEIISYQMQPVPTEIGQEMILTLAWQPLPNTTTPLSLFIHLVGGDGRISAQQDLTVMPQPEGVTLTQFRLTARPGTAPGEFNVLVGVAGHDERILLTPVTLQPMTHPPNTQHPTYQIVWGERPLRHLIGYDWDTTLTGQTRLYLHWQTTQGYQTEVHDNVTAESLVLPPFQGPWGFPDNNWAIQPANQSHYVPLGQGITWIGDEPLPPDLVAGETVRWRQQFVSSQPVTHDLVVSVRLIGYENNGFNWNWTDQNDSVPAMGAIPTLKWVIGSQITSPHFLEVAEAIHVEQKIGGTLRLYDAFTNRPLPILDERLTDQFPWIPLDVP